MFDRELEAEKTLVVIARDGGPNRTDAERNSAACQITVQVGDENDNRPVFAIKDFQASVYDRTPVGTVVLITSAIDRDAGTNAKITYSMDSHTYFEILDSTKGEISVKSSLVGKSEVFQFIVKATDSGTPEKKTSSATVKITVGASIPPKFTSSTYRVSIVENLPAGSPVITVKANSHTGSRVAYVLPYGNLRETNKAVFAINSDTGVIHVGTEVDYETIKSYIVYVEAKDNANDMVSSAIVYIDTIDANDNLPFFILPKFEYITVTEGQAAGRSVGRLFASDKDSGTNAEFTYSIKSFGRSNNFTVDENTGELRTTKTFDREENDRESFTVQVTDKYDSTLYNNAPVFVKIIDINDNAPILTPKVYTGRVKEDASVGHKVIAIHARDLDTGENAKVQFYITGGNEKGYFTTSKSTFSSQTSTAYILVGKPLDREKDARFQLTIAATDSKFTDTGVINIEVS